MNDYRMVIRDAGGAGLATVAVPARSLDVAAGAMRAALRADPLAARVELWLGDARVSVVVRRRKRLVMTQDEPRLSSRLRD